MPDSAGGPFANQRFPPALGVDGWPGRAVERVLSGRDAIRVAVAVAAAVITASGAAPIKPAHKGDTNQMVAPTTQIAGAGAGKR